MFNSSKILVLGSDENSIEVMPRKSARAKKISLKISSNKGVELIVPKHVSIERAIKFLYSKEEWIIEKSHKVMISPKAPMQIGSIIPIEGKRYTIKHSGNIRGVTHIEENYIIVSGPEEFAPRKVIEFLKVLAKKEIVARAEVEAMKLGVSFKSVTVRDTTSRWGSCSAKKALSFSWRLIMAPRHVLEYVVAHEVAHLLEMNHGKKFWQLVESIFPDHMASRRWLKENGSLLHSYQ